MGEIGSWDLGIPQAAACGVTVVVASDIMPIFPGSRQHDLGTGAVPVFGGNT